MSSTFSYVEGPRLNSDDICFEPAKINLERATETLTTAFSELQWSFIPARRTNVSNSLLSTAYPGIDVANHPAFTTTDIIHLHWPTWGITPATLEQWLRAGRHIFWTLHDCWAMTGGCHYPAGCKQFLSHCLKCPQLQDDLGLVSANFVDKLRHYGNGGSLTIVSPSEWLANEARQSRVLAGRKVAVVRNSIELDVFTPREDRSALRASFGLNESDLLVFFGSYDLKERRKGVGFLIQALATLGASDQLSAMLPPGGRIFLASVGRSSAIEKIQGTFSLDFGHVDNDEVMADVLGIADLVCVPSLEDNYPNVIVEAMACGTPVLGTPVGGIAEMIEDGVTGLLASEVGSADALAVALLRFAKLYHGSTTMREAARAATERVNNPSIVGLQLRELYESVLGRSMATTTQTLRNRMSRVFAKAPVLRRVPDSGELLAFPMNMALMRQLPQDRGLQTVTSSPVDAPQDGRRRIMTVRTYHGHHSARSGPYQFARYLDQVNYNATHVAVPLGTELAGEQAETYRRAGILLGAKAFGQQANAWLAEGDVLFRCASEPFDLVHFVDGELGGWLVPGMPDGIFAKGQRPAIVTTFHQPTVVLEGLINPGLLREFDAVIALCRSQRDFLASYVEPDRIFLVPHGIDTGFFSPPPASYVRAAAAAFRVLMIGHWLRDLAVAMDAFQALRDRGVEAELTVISPTFPTVHRRSGVTIRSGVSDEDLRQAYWDTDVVFIPLKDATANNALLEAMACGCPVVSTDVGGVREGVGDDAGILCAPGDAAAHAEALFRLAKSPDLRRQCGEKGRERALTMDWKQAARLHEQVYDAVLQRRRGVTDAAALFPPAKAEAPSVVPLEACLALSPESVTPPARAGGATRQSRSGGTGGGPTPREPLLARSELRSKRRSPATDGAPPIRGPVSKPTRKAPR